MSIDDRASAPTTDPLDGHASGDSQRIIAVEGTISPQANARSTPIGHASAGLQDSLGGQLVGGDHETCAAEGPNHPQARDESPTSLAAPAGSDSLGGQRTLGAHQVRAVEGSTSPQANRLSSPNLDSPAGSPILLTAWPEVVTRDVAAAADTLNDIEELRIACENRLRQFVRPQGEPDKDGKYRGFGWNLTVAAVKNLAELVAGMRCDSSVVATLGIEVPPHRAGCCLEHDAERNLTRALRAHPLGPWVRSKDQKGIGEKQGARLIGILGDPYVRPALKRDDGTVEPMRPRTVSELRAYCGYGEDRTRPGRIQRRQRGQAANWSAAAKMRAHLVAAQCIKSGLSKAGGCMKVEGDDFYTHGPECQCSRYRLVYDRERVRYADAVHAEDCVRCGPAGKPAAAGSPLSAGHKHGRALRRVAKEVLDDLWREARRIHLETPASGQSTVGSQGPGAAGGD